MPAQFDLNGIAREDGFRALASDISEEGMSFRADHSFHRGDRLQIAVRIAQAEPPVRVLCEVRHSQRHGLTGVEFLEVSPQDRERVLQIVDYELGSQGN